MSVYSLIKYIPNVIYSKTNIIKIKVNNLSTVIISFVWMALVISFVWMTLVILFVWMTLVIWFCFCFELYRSCSPKSISNTCVLYAFSEIIFSYTSLSWLLQLWMCFVVYLCVALYHVYCSLCVYVLCWLLLL